MFQIERLSKLRSDIGSFVSYLWIIINVYRLNQRSIVVVKKTLRFTEFFCYNHLCRQPLFRNINMESGIIFFFLLIQSLIMKTASIFGHLKKVWKEFAKNALVS
jgi:hypothetical protein